MYTAVDRVRAAPDTRVPLSQSPDDPVRLSLRYHDVETFIVKFAPNVTRGGIFLATREPRPVGDVLRFEVRLATEELALSGEGRVSWVKDWNPKEPTRAHGMGVQFIYVDPDARPMLERLLKQKEPARRPTPLPPSVASPGALAVGPAEQTSQPLVDRRRTRPSAEDLNEFDAGVAETAIRRALERARSSSLRDEDLDALLAPETESEPTLEMALAELPRLLSGNRRNTGLFRTIGSALVAPGDTNGSTNRDTNGSVPLGGAPESAPEAS